MKVCCVCMEKCIEDDGPRMTPIEDRWHWGPDGMHVHFRCEAKFRRGEIHRGVEHFVTCNEFLERVYGIADSDDAARVVYETMDAAFTNGEFDWCNVVLARVDLPRTCTLRALSFLTISFAAKDVLPARVWLLARIRAWLPSQGYSLECIDELLRGLK